MLDRVGKVVYRLSLPSKFSQVHIVFHVSMLWKYILDSSHIIQHDDLDIEEKISLEEQPFQIIERKEHQLQHKLISMVMLQWKHHKENEATWEQVDKIQELYLGIPNKSQR